MVVCVKEVGFDVIEIYVVYGYLIYEFLFLFFNYCIDEYGGLLENCYCFLREVIDEVK